MECPQELFLFGELIQASIGFSALCSISQFGIRHLTQDGDPSIGRMFRSFDSEKQSLPRLQIKAFDYLSKAIVFHVQT
jgi:hypothetical protein